MVKCRAEEGKEEEEEEEKENLKKCVFNVCKNESPLSYFLRIFFKKNIYINEKIGRMNLSQILAT